jgi:hypothetical protein
MKKMLLLVLALIVVPAWAADAVPAPSSTPSAQTEQAAPNHKTSHKKHKAKKADKKAETSPQPASALICTKQICGGASGCYQPRCGAVCTTGC